MMALVSLLMLSWVYLQSHRSRASTIRMETELQIMILLGITFTPASPQCHVGSKQERSLHNLGAVF